MKKKNIKPEEVEVVIPKEVEAINICGDINSFIKHIIYVSLDKVSSDRAFEDIGRDVNVVYPIEIGKMFKGFYILSNGAVAINYELTDNGGFENDDSIGKIDMNLN